METVLSAKSSKEAISFSLRRPDSRRSESIVFSNEVEGSKVPAREALVCLDCFGVSFVGKWRWSA